MVEPPHRLGRQWVDRWAMMCGSCVKRKRLHCKELVLAVIDSVLDVFVWCVCVCFCAVGDVEFLCKHCLIHNGVW